MRKIAEIGKIFEHRHVLGEERDMRLKFGGLSIINRGGVDSHGLDLPLTHEPGRRLGMQAREMERLYTLLPSQLCSQILSPRRPVSGKARVEQHDRSVWNSPVPCLPLLEILDGDEVISITGTLGCDVDSDTSSNQAFDRDLIQRLPTLGKVNGRIDVGAPMFGHLQAIRSVVVPAWRLSRLLEDEPEVLFSRPYNRVRPEGMSEIDEPRLLPGKAVKPRMTGSASRTSQHAQHNKPAGYLMTHIHP